MKKIYLVSEDNYSGKVVIICETSKKVHHICTNPDQVKYLYDEPIYREEERTEYRVRAYFNYDKGETRDNILFDEATDCRELALRFFEEAKELTR